MEDLYENATPYERNILNNTKAASTDRTTWGESEYDNSYKAPDETKEDILKTRAENEHKAKIKTYKTVGMV